MARPHCGVLRCLLLFCWGRGGVPGEREVRAIAMTVGAGCTVLEMSRLGHLYGGDKNGVVLRVHRRELDAIGTSSPGVVRVLAGRGAVRALALGNGLVYTATATAARDMGSELQVFTPDLNPLCTLVDRVMPALGILAITVRAEDDTLVHRILGRTRVQRIGVTATHMTVYRYLRGYLKFPLPSCSH